MSTYRGRADALPELTLRERLICEWCILVIRVQTALGRMAPSTLCELEDEFGGQALTPRQRAALRLMLRRLYGAPEPRV